MLVAALSLRMKLVRAAAALALTLVGHSAIAQSPGSTGEALPILGVAGITFRVSSLDKARRYYEGLLGLPEAFTLKDDAGRVNSIFFKVNDDQYVEIVPGLAANGLNRQVRVLIQSFDLKRLHEIYAARGLNPSAITHGPDGNPVFRVVGPENATLDFIQYVPDSMQSRARGRLLDTRRISRHLEHVSIFTRNPAAVKAFYQDRLGFPKGKDLPGGRGEFIEAASSDRNLETKWPRLDPNNPATRAQYDREVVAANQHFGLVVPDMRFARDLAQERGRLTDVQVRVHVGGTRRWIMHLFDPDGNCTELMENEVQEGLPPMTVMAPGREVGPPILPTTPGVIPWPNAGQPGPNAPVTKTPSS
jgi:catechol 2,3-dioxygenase-like lactoylglutathione lyase family enzyme